MAARSLVDGPGSWWKVFPSELRGPRWVFVGFVCPTRAMRHQNGKATAGRGDFRESMNRRSSLGIGTPSHPGQAGGQLPLPDSPHFSVDRSLCRTLRASTSPWLFLPFSIPNVATRLLQLPSVMLDLLCSAVALAALAARAFARFATSAAFRAGDSFFFATAFFAAVFFCAAGFVFAAAAWTAAHLFFVASEIAFLPAALSFRFGFGGFCRGWRWRLRFSPYFGPSKLLGFFHSSSSGCGELPAFECGRFRRGGGVGLVDHRPTWSGVLRSVCRYAAFLVQSRRWRR